MTEAPSAADLALLDPDGTFVLRLTTDRARLQDLAGIIEETAPPDDRLASLEVIAHRLGGAAGTFGHAGVSAAAIDLDNRVIDLRKGTGDRQGVARALATLLQTLDRAIAVTRR